jgi:Ser/Thr protein kinase RdoA (MazF antagonist)
LLRSSFDTFIEDIAPRLELLPKQIIHNDFNPDNLLLSTSGGAPLIGVLDFGDAVIAPRVVDLAVAASYHIAAEPNVHYFDTALEVIAGYHERLSLTENEIDLLYPLIVTRVAIAISIASWRAIRFPNNNDYILRNTAAAWNRLRLLLDAGADDIANQIKTRCEQP